MAKTKISEFDSNPVNNTDIDGINLAEGMAPGLVNNALRELMAQLKNQLTGTDDDNHTIGGNLVVNGTLTVGSNLADAFPSGTKLLFNQTTAPTGWVKDTTHNNKALRVVSGTAGSGGSVAFTTAFSSSSVGATTLTEAQLPSHNHSFSGTTVSAGGHTHTITDPGHNHRYGANYNAGLGQNGPSISEGSSYNTSTKVTGISINAVGGHDHTFSGTTGAVGSSATHTHSLSLAVQYVDVIIATKD
jgi:hypothetical protein